MLDSLRQIEQGAEFWSARQLAKTLEYSSYPDFLLVIEKAKEVCKRPIAEHFSPVHQRVFICFWPCYPVFDVKLSRYACHLIAWQADLSKGPIIASARSYFVVDFQ